tara:strand:+ start:177 stop:470 length:294 start_codon:yes stop_codon:yes gene_type:complete
MVNKIFLIRNLPKNKKKNAIIDFLKLKNQENENELEFYKQIFKRRYNSAIFNLRIKTINGKKIWIDKVLDRSNRELLLSLDKDDEVIEWLTPCRCER